MLGYVLIVDLDYFYMRKHLKDLPCHSLSHCVTKMDIWNFANDLKLIQGNSR